LTDVKLPPTIAVVVDSEVLGKTAFSVPATDLTGAAIEPGPNTMLLAVDRQEIEDELDRRETRYLDSHSKPAPEERFTVPSQPFQEHMIHAIDTGTDNWDTIADRLNWWRVANDRPDGKRADGQKVRYYVMESDAIPGDIARELAEAMSMEPHEVGL